MIRNSILAGIMIGIGDMAVMSCDNKYIGALLFSVALMSVIYFELPLFTGEVGRVTHDKSYIYCLVVLFFNLIGVLISVYGFSLIDVKNYDKIILISNNKFSIGYISLFIAAIFCNVLIYMAVSSKHTILVILCIMTFILCGFEHSIADAGYAFIGGNFKNIISWLIVLVGNIVGGILAFYLLNEEEEFIDGESAE